MRDLEPVSHARALEGSVQAAPSDDLWLIGHRILRDVPRVAAVWTFLAEELRALMRPRVVRPVSPRGRGKSAVGAAARAV